MYFSQSLLCSPTLSLSVSSTSSSVTVSTHPHKTGSNLTFEVFFYDFTNTEQLIEDVVTESYNFFNNKYFIFNIILVDLLWLGLVVATFTQLVLFLQTYNFRQTTELIKNEFNVSGGSGNMD